MYATFCFSIFLGIIRLIICEDECGSPHEVENAKISNPSDTAYVVGSTITYKCEYGYIIGGVVKTSKCVRDRETNEPIWTEPEFTCNPRPCGDPGNVENARRVGSRFTFPNHVQYVCNEGYKLFGSPRRYCEASGVWSGKLPSCRAVTCGRPENPENGRAIYTALNYNSELRYECNRDLQLFPKEPRYCGADGTWTGTAPVCREVECEMPGKPEFGSVEIVGNQPKVGSIALYKCDPGRKIFGSTNSKCLISGEWTFPTPLCVEPCVIPYIANGELGVYVEERRRYRWVTVFQTVNEGTTMDENEQVTLKCNTDYVPKSQSLREIIVTCQGGHLSPEPECVPTRCLGDPPSVANGKAQTGSRQHGLVIWYRCESGFVKQGTGNVKCEYGSWIGDPPACADNRCHKSSLNYPGLVKSQEFLYDGQSFTPTCLSGYEISENSDQRIYCRSGTWSGNLPPCTIGRCKTEDLAGLNGLVLEGDRTLDDGDWFSPKCAEGFEFSNKEDSRLYCREGVWQGNLPPCTPAHCSNNPPIIENGRIKSFRGIGHGSSVEYECLMYHEMDGKGSVVCNHGQWTGSPPTCKDTRCYRRNLPGKDGVDLTDDSPVGSNRKANIVCIRGYNLRYPEVYCEKGKWTTENLLSPCQENECEVKKIHNGKILKERIFQIKNMWGTVTGTNTVRESADIGSSETTGAVLYVECNGRYKFQGQGAAEEHTRITCRRGEWTPFPVCQLPGEPLEIDVSVTDEPIVSEDVGILPNSQLNGSAVKKLETNNGTSVSDQTPFSANNSLGENIDDGLVIMDSNFTESEELVPTDATVKPPCSCTYIVQNRILVGHDGNKVVKYGDEIPSGSVIAFYCNTTGYFRLKGRSSIKCPEDCNWNSNLFPSCVSPSDDDVITRVFADPSKNMEVGPGGVLFVIPGTKLQFTCRIKSGYRNSIVNWTPPSNSGFHDSGTDSNGFFKAFYTVHSALPRDSGRYTCFNQYGPSHTLEVSVAEKECEELESTEELAISYAPQDRKYNSRATFHCFSPYMRNGPSFITCEASGFWSGPPASCYLPTCSVGSIYDIIPEGVVPIIDGDISENVQFGHELRLGCDGVGKVVRGDNTAICSEEGKWKAGEDIHCAQGCAGWRKKNGSTLLISPNKQFYDMGESVTFSCPEGKELTIDVQRILCFSDGWTPNTIPDCQ